MGDQMNQLLDEYMQKWFDDSLVSAETCIKSGRLQLAWEYVKHAQTYLVRLKEVANG